MSKHIATSREWLTSQLEALLRSYESDFAILSKRDRGHHAAPAAIVDDLMVRAGDSTQAIVGDAPFFVAPITVDSLTDEQIASVRDDESLSLTARTCAAACLDASLPRDHVIKVRNRERCVAILNATAWPAKSEREDT